MSEHRIINGMPADSYHKEPGVSASLICEAHTSLAHAKAYMDGKINRDTKALSLGTLVHSMVLTPQDLASYAVKPAGMKLNTKAGMAWEAEQQGKEIVSTPEWDCAKGIADAIAANPDAMQFLTDGLPEQSLFVQDSHGTLRKSRFDYLQTAGSALVDLKKTRDCSPSGFEKVILNYNYHIRAAYYIDNANLAGLEKEDFVFITAEPEPPYCVSVYRLDPVVIDYGRMLYKAALQRLRNAQESGHWPGYVEGVTMIQLPPWEQKIAEDVA